LAGFGFGHLFGHLFSLDFAFALFAIWFFFVSKGLQTLPPFTFLFYHAPPQPWLLLSGFHMRLRHVVDFFLVLCIDEFWACVFFPPLSFV